MLALKVVSAIVTCLFGVWAYLADARDQGRLKLGASGRVRIVGLIVSLIFTLAVIILDSGGRPVVPTSVASVPGSAAALSRPIEDLQFRYVLSYSLKNPLLTPLKAKVDEYVRSHPQSALADENFEDNKEGIPRQTYYIPYSIVRKSPVDHLARGQDLIVNFYSKGTQARDIPRNGIFKGEEADDHAYRVDKTPKGEIELKFPAFDGNHSDQYNFIYDATNEQIFLARKKTTGAIHDYWKTDTISTFGDLLGSLMLVRIKVSDMETLPRT